MKPGAQRPPTSEFSTYTKSKLPQLIADRFHRKIRRMQKK